MLEPPDDPKQSPQIEEALSKYLEALTAGQEVDPLRVLAENPTLGPEIIESLQQFVDFGQDATGGKPLGALGDYTLRRRVGRGGMGVVYEAWQNSLERRVALKVLPTGLAADTTSCSRFLREAQIAAKLSHPNVVAVYGFGVESNTPYFAMEFVEGQTLADVLKTSGSPAQSHGGLERLFGARRDGQRFYRRVASAFAQVSDGLQHAHSRGIVHRDIKPSNLIADPAVDESGMPEGRLRILDFGLARLEGQERLTATGDVMGTPLYMSPEQALSKRIPIDHRTDVYSLGVTLYETLAGCPPFEGKSHQQTLSQIISREPPSLQQLDPRIPSDLETIAFKCLRKDANDRYRTAEALAQDLRRFSRGDPIEAVPVGRWERFARTVHRRWRGLAAGTMLLALGLSAGLLVLEHIKKDARRREAEYDSRLLGVAARIQLDGATIHARAGSPTLLDPEGIFQLFHHRTTLPGEGKGSLETLLVELETLAASVPWRPDAWFHRARTLELLGRDEEARMDLQKALGQDPAFAPALVLLGRILAKSQGDAPDPRRVEKALEDAVAPWGRAWLRAEEALATGDWATVIEESKPLLAKGIGYVGLAVEARLGRGYARMRAGDFDGAVEDLGYAKEHWPDLLAPYMLLAETYGREGHRDAAQRILQEAYERTDSPEVAAVWATVFCRRFTHLESGLRWAQRAGSFWSEAQLLTSLGREDELRSLTERQLAAKPQDVDALLYLAYLEERPARTLGGTPEGKRSLEATERIASRILAIDPDAWFAHALQGRLLLLRGRLENARKAFEAERARHGDIAHVLGYVSFCYHQAGLYRDAGDAARAELQTGVHAADAYGQLGRVALREERLEEAEDWLVKATAANPVEPDWHAYLGQVCQQTGRAVEAVEHFLCALELPREAAGYYVGVPACGRHLRQLFLDLDWDTVPEDVEERIRRFEDASRTRPSAALLKAFSVWRLRSVRWGDTELALARAQEAVELTGSRDPEVLADMARVLHARDRTIDAIVSLERAVHLSTANQAIQKLLDEYRQDALPDVASCASVDALVDRLSTDPVALRTKLQELAAHSRDRGPSGVTAYLEARLLECEGDSAGAQDVLQSLVSVPEAPVEAFLRRADVLLTLGRAEDSLAAVEQGLAMYQVTDPALFKRWAKGALVDLALPPEAALERFKALSCESEDPTTTSRQDDIVRLLGELAAGRPLRIDCGASMDPTECPRWSRDRFSAGGYSPKPSFREIAETEEEAVYQTARYFWRDALSSGYAIPLPPGRWTVTLHFAEIREWEPGRRRFSVEGEGRRILEGFDPAAEGISRAVERSEIVTVMDGVLDLKLVAEVGDAFLSAIEVNREDG